MINGVTAKQQEDDSRKVKNHGKLNNLILFTALTAYLSTPKFVKTLTDISYELIAVPDREAYLNVELRKVNR
jgi:hypothetical protein